MADPNQECNNNVPSPELPEHLKGWHVPMEPAPSARSRDPEPRPEPIPKHYADVYVDGVWKRKLIHCGGYVQLSDHNESAPMVPLSDLFDMERSSGKSLVVLVPDE